MIIGYSPGLAPVSYPGLLAPAQGGIVGPPGLGGINFFNLLLVMLRAFSQLAQGWGNIGGRPPQPAPGQGLQGPADPNEFASYLAAQRAGGSLEGKTGIAQRDALAGTRFASVQDPQAWHASVARNYAFQFAAFASGNNALTPQGLAAGQQAFQQMAPEAQLFMQVASVFKGNSFGGPGFYDNPGLKQLLLNTGNADLANLDPQVGRTDVQSIGAVAAAIDRGTLSLNQVLGSGTIDNLDRYHQIIGYVQNGGFAGDVARYEATGF